jgi:FlaG/FlaF family flagellin (archaellin)
MSSKYRTIAIAFILAGASLTAILAQTQANSVASGQREILLQTTQSWNGKPYTHYPAGQPRCMTRPAARLRSFIKDKR